MYTYNYAIISLSIYGRVFNRKVVIVAWNWFSFCTLRLNLFIFFLHLTHKNAVFNLYFHTKTPIDFEKHFMAVYSCSTNYFLINFTFNFFPSFIKQWFLLLNYTMFFSIYFIWFIHWENFEKQTFRLNDFKTVFPFCGGGSEKTIFLS